MSTTSRPALCFISTGPVMPGVLTREMPEQMGGAELQLKELAFRLADRGWPVSFLLGDYGPIAPCLHPGVRLVTAHAPQGGGGSPLKLIADARLIWQALEETGADIFFENGIGGVSGVVALFARMKHKQFVMWMASDSDPQCRVPGVSRVPRAQRRAAHYALRTASLLLAQSTGQQALARTHVGREAIILPNVWPGPYEITEPNREKEYVLWVGSIRPVKRPMMVPEVASLLPDIPFRMVGGPTRGQESLHEDLIAAAATTANLNFIGFVPPGLIDAHYAGAAALLCTSQVEGLPNTFLHAWGRGKPVVSTYDPAGMIAEHGLGVTASSLEDLADGLRHYWDNPGSAMETGQRAQDYVRRHHHPDIVMAQLEQMLSSL